MPSSPHLPDTVFRLTSNIEILPVRHGSGDVAQEIRNLLLTRRIECLAIPLPPSVEHEVERGISFLPAITLITLPEASDSELPQFSTIPIDPCQPVIMAIRFAMAEGIDRAYIDREVQKFEPVRYQVPDPYALKQVSLAGFSSALLPFLPYPKPDSQRWARITWMAFKLHELELDYQSILCLCPLEDWPWLREAYREQPPYGKPETLSGRPVLCRIAPHTLYFTLCELPYITELYERRRVEARSDHHLSVDGIKELLIEARKRWMENQSPEIRQERNWVTPQLLQMFLQYVRNLALLEHRLTSDLYTLILAAKQFAGDGFAATLLDTAKSYAWGAENIGLSSLPSIAVGIDKIEFMEGEVGRGINRFQSQHLRWRSLSLKPAPPPPVAQRWAFKWNPFGQCSWPPEDQKIEGFAAHVREQAKQCLGADLARVEKFTSSIRDGIDLRETLRHWKESASGQSPDIYVKDIPPTRGNVEVVIFLFEVPADPQKFTWQATWYAEHEEESTLCFFATPFLEHMIGPGIGQSLYGGTLFLFPPRPIPNIWEDPRLEFAQSLEDRLIAGGAAHSQFPHVVLVSPIPPLARWRKIARRFGRTLIPLPLTRFSGQTIARLRQFHVLNGHDIRSYAAKFIRE